MRILVSGATGFIGKRLVEKLLTSTFTVVAGVRTPAHLACDSITVGEIDGATDWARALTGVDTVVHLAGRVHVMNESAADPMAEFRRVNVDGTLNLAGQAVKAGVSRFIFLSTVKVNGEATELDRPFTPADPPLPVDPYGISKYEAEEGLRRLAAETGLEVVIIRPPLVYGPGVRANFFRMISWLNRGIPLPLADIANKRSLIFLDNLVDLIITCLNHPAAANQTFLVSDGEDLSTSELLGRIGRYLGKPVRLWSVHPLLLKTVAVLIGKGEMSDRLLGSLQVDSCKTTQLLGWQPEFTTDAALAITVRAYLENIC